MLRRQTWLVRITCTDYFKIFLFHRVLVSWREARENTDLTTWKVLPQFTSICLINCINSFCILASRFGLLLDLYECFFWEGRSSLGDGASQMSFCQMQFTNQFLRIEIFPALVQRKEFWIDFLILNLLLIVLLTLDGPFNIPVFHFFIGKMRMTRSQSYLQPTAF